MGDIAASAVDALRNERREGLRRFMGQSLSRKHRPLTAALSREGRGRLTGDGLLLDARAVYILPNRVHRIAALSADLMSEHNGNILEPLACGSKGAVKQRSSPTRSAP